MKKIVLTGAILLTLAGAGIPASANIQPAQETPMAENVEITEIVVNLPPEEASPAQEPIHESKIARKMTQAEKAHNAAVNDSWGGAITIIAMCIVVMALAILSILFLGFGKISEAFMKRTKKKAKEAALHEENDDHMDLAHGEVIAAITAALSQHFGEGHDMEDTILTIKRMQRAYSPWNSKIYNLRPSAEHVRTAMKLPPVGNNQ